MCQDCFNENKEMFPDGSPLKAEGPLRRIPDDRIGIIQVPGRSGPGTRCVDAAQHVQADDARPAAAPVHGAKDRLHGPVFEQDQGEARPVPDAGVPVLQKPGELPQGGRVLHLSQGIGGARPDPGFRVLKQGADLRDRPVGPADIVNPAFQKR